MRASFVRAERGAALLTAMVIVTLVSTLAAGMIWQQWRAVQVEAAERARTQAQWILGGAIDWARLILREDARSGGPDHLGEPWAVPLAEAKLSTFLAADRENTDDAPEAFLSGSIVDAQSRYNLRNVIESGASGSATAKSEERTLQRLFELAGAPVDGAAALARALRAAAPRAPESAASGPQDPTPADPALMPERIEQLVWLGVDAATLAQIRSFVTLLPTRTPINLNTAPKEVIAAAIPNLDLATAERVLQARQRNPFKAVAELSALLPEGTALDTASALDVRSSYFEVRGRLRLQDRVVEERGLVRRNNLDVQQLTRQRVTALDLATP